MQSPTLAWLSHASLMPTPLKALGGKAQLFSNGPGHLTACELPSQAPTDPAQTPHNPLTGDSN